MIDIRPLRRDLGITKTELIEITRITGIGRFRMLMVEHGLLTLDPADESTVRLAFAYIMHCRSVRLALKVAQGPLVRPTPMTWDEYLKDHRRE